MCLTSGCRRRCSRPGVRFGAFAFTKGVPPNLAHNVCLFVQDRSRRCCNLLRAVQALVPHSCPIQMVKQGGQLEIKFHMCLIEDRSAAPPSLRARALMHFISETAFSFLQPHESAVVPGVVGSARPAEPVDLVTEFHN